MARQISYPDALDTLDPVSYTHLVDIFTDVEANPSVTTVEKATEAYKESGADFIVALGGGSPMDVAKAVGVTAK